MNPNYFKLTILIAFGIVSNTIQGQQTPIFTNYNYNTVVLNPAHAGYYEDIDVTVISTGNFHAIEGGARDTQLTVNAPLRSKHVGLAGGVSRDQIGVSSVTNFFGAYSYKIFFDSEYAQGKWWAYDPNIISFGITAGGSIYDEKLLELGIENDPNFQENIHTLIPNIGVGFLYNKDHFYLGLSAPNLFGSSLSNETNLNIKSNYYGYLGYRFFTNQFEEVLINPSTLIKYVSGAPLQVDFNLMANYKNIVEVGAGYRSCSAVNFLAGFYLFDHWRIMYSYNYSLESATINNTHSLVLNYRLGKGFER
nr:PorP/SprF family type IX secretion system membrane protein [uncultured Flavobacterium sp.]